MNAEPWDRKKKYNIGEIALVAGVECIAINEDWGQCYDCPQRSQCGYACQQACVRSIGRGSCWHPAEKVLLRHLKGEI